MEIKGPISLGELIDKITILEIKKESKCRHCGITQEEWFSIGMPVSLGE